MGGVSQKRSLSSIYQVFAGQSIHSRIFNRAGGSGCAGCAAAHPILGFFVIET